MFPSSCHRPYTISVNDYLFLRERLQESAFEIPVVARPIVKRTVIFIDVGLLDQDQSVPLIAANNIGPFWANTKNLDHTNVVLLISFLFFPMKSASWAVLLLQPVFRKTAPIPVFIRYMRPSTNTMCCIISQTDEQCVPVY